MVAKEVDVNVVINKPDHIKVANYALKFVQIFLIIFLSISTSDYLASK